MKQGDDKNAVSWLDRPGLPRLAYCQNAGLRENGPGILFLSGFGSDMTGSKAMALHADAVEKQRCFTRFDYSGHGQSQGNFADGAIGDWLTDALAVFDSLTQGPQILVGSSMGGWIAVLLAIARPERVQALVGIAAAPDFTERLIWQKLTQDQRAKLLREGALYPPSDYGEPLPITLKLIEDGRHHLLLDRQIPFQGKVRLLHGQCDPDVPWQLSLTTAERLAGADVTVTLIKDGDHRLSRSQDIALLIRTLDALWNEAAAVA